MLVEEDLTEVDEAQGVVRATDVVRVFRREGECFVEKAACVIEAL